MTLPKGAILPVLRYRSHRTAFDDKIECDEPKGFGRESKCTQADRLLIFGASVAEFDSSANTCRFGEDNYQL
jgi:hypothetical protein